MKQNEANKSLWGTLIISHVIISTAITTWLLSDAQSATHDPQPTLFSGNCLSPGRLFLAASVYLGSSIGFHMGLPKKVMQSLKKLAAHQSRAPKSVREP